MKKIAILSLHLGYGGIEKSVIALANLLCDTYDVSIYCTYKLFDEPAFNLDSRVKVEYLLNDLKPNRREFREALHSFHLITLIRESFKANKILYLRRKTMISRIKESDADIIISTRDIFNYWLGEYAREGVLKVGWEHNHYHGDYNYAMNITKSASRLDYLVLVSEALCKYYKKQLANTHCKCVYIPNMIDKIPDGCALLKSRRIVSVGRLSKEKGYMDLLRIFRKIHSDNPSWKLDIIGDGEERSNLEGFIKTNSLEKVVTLHGFRSREYIDDILHSSSIYVMTSYTESFGIVLIEAMSHGLPCIAFDSAEGARELINSGMNGYLIKNRSFPAMVKKITDLMNNYDNRKKIGMAGRSYVKKYTSDVVKDSWLDLFKRG